MDALLTDIRDSHQLIEERLARARASRGSPDPGQPRDEYPAIDTFLATASRYYTALSQVLIPAARTRLPDGHLRAKAFLTQSRHLALALNQAKAKLYGSVYAVNRSWREVWDDIERELLTIAPMELALAEDLDRHRQEGDPDWSTVLHRAEVKAPTRPHPHLPQQGVAGSVARMLSRRVDSFWDTAEGRMMPEPVIHHDREAQGPLTQWLLGDPHLQARAGLPDRLHRPPADTAQPDQTEQTDQTEQPGRPEDPA
ncbi:hypothetical protein [Nocardioides gilvus]|uniref:hypothetical protein n=1 Tax=Nocardioides gilvus TaxID=1735589 RepID=UPI000D7412EE|nr:hypothetical protein [Nocardioides gilvus]